MRITSGRMMARLAQAALLLFIAPAALAGDTDNFVTVDGIGVFYAVVPAEMIRDHPSEHPEATMHGGVPGSKHSHHVMVALFESDTFERITDADVRATVAEIGLGGPDKPLEPFTVAGALTYGNYFEMRTSTLYRISVRIERPGVSKIVKAQFDYNHH